MSARLPETDPAAIIKRPRQQSRKSAWASAIPRALGGRSGPRQLGNAGRWGSRQLLIGIVYLVFDLQVDQFDFPFSTKLYRGLLRLFQEQRLHDPVFDDVECR